MFIGIDIGHTNVKAVAFDTDWSIVDEVGKEDGMVHPIDGHTEIRIERREEIVLECLDTLENQLRSGERIEGIGLAGGGGGLYPLNREMEPFMNGIPLLDERARGIYERWKDDGTYREICEITGTPIPPGAAIIVLKWLKENEPENYDTIEHILNLKDIIRFKLTGELALEISDATFSFTNHATQEYDEKLFELADIQDVQDKLPELAASSHEVAGHTTREIEQKTGIDAGTPVVTGAHDACANSLGVGAVGENIVTTAGGTWSLSTMILDEPSVQLDRWCCENFLERGTWMLEIASPTGTSALNWFVDEFCEPERREAEQKNVPIWDILESKIAGVETSVVFHPYLFGNPYGYMYDDSASGSFTGLRPTDRREDMLRAVYEAIAFMHRWQLEQFDDAFGVEEVRFTGGAARSDFWAGMFADVMDRPITTTTTEESGCLGAAMLAAIGVGEIANLEETADIVEIDEVYYPSERTYERNYKTFKELSTLLEPSWEIHDDLRH